MTLVVRSARHADGVAMSAVRRLAIEQLCGLDHGNDPAAIARWTDNQSAESFQAMLLERDVTVLVADNGQTVVGVVGRRGNVVTLNYVHPEHRFSGIGKAMMAAIESHMAVAGTFEARLHSTATALPFYRRLGWRDCGAGHSETGYPMSKLLERAITPSDAADKHRRQ